MYLCMKTWAYGRDRSCLEGTHTLVSMVLASFRISWSSSVKSRNMGVFIFMGGPIAWYLNFPSLRHWDVYSPSFLWLLLFLPLTLHLFILSWEIRKLLPIYVYFFSLLYSIPIPNTLLVRWFQNQAEGGIHCQKPLVFHHIKITKLFPSFVVPICIFTQKLWESKPPWPAQGWMLVELEMLSGRGLARTWNDCEKQKQGTEVCWGWNWRKQRNLRFGGPQQESFEKQYQKLLFFPVGNVWLRKDHCLFLMFKTG